MPAVIALKDVIEALEMASDELVFYLNPETGEVREVSYEDRAFLEEGDSSAEEIVESDKWLALPDRFEIHEWSIMEQFALSVPQKSDQYELCTALHGTGAFRYFKDTIHRLGLEKQWYAYRDDALQEIARSWLEENGLRYE